MAAGLALTAAQTIISMLDSSALKEVCSMFGHESQLEELKGTLSTVRAVLLDADSKQDELSHEAQNWFEKLKQAVYEVNDLLDKLFTFSEQQKHRKQTDGNQDKFFHKVRQFFSRSNQLIAPFTRSQDINKIRKKLDAIASDHSKFGFSVNYEPIRKRSREETGSHIREESIIGREVDKEAIVSLLLGDSNNGQENISFVIIAGIGGLGKTALAQLVYNDDRVESAFQLRLWVCVSEEFGMREILSKMLKLGEDQRCDDLVMDKIQKKVREQIEGKKYLLVLDDVWAESRNEWVKLMDLLMWGGRGSRILVTTRSKLVARAIGINYPVHELKGLSEEDSWCLFKRMAFEQGREPTDSELVEIGKSIVQKCAYVPLSIRVIGSSLYGQERSRWMSFENSSNILKLKVGEDDTLTILRFSYHHLTPSLKACFSFCSIFPKDWELSKHKLIDLWLAHGYIEALYEGQSIEDAGEDHFSILLNRCFFQDINTDGHGKVYSCKMHDLVHDLAQEVAGNETLIWPSRCQLDKKIHHLSITCSDKFDNLSDSLVKMKTLRTFLQTHTGFISQPVVSVILSTCKFLRVLDLRGPSGNLDGFLIQSLPPIICKLIHLRYLDLSCNKGLKMLPESITELHNLEVLKLYSCFDLEVLPKELSKLVNLRQLDLTNCYLLTYMPKGMSNLIRLQTLSRFVVGEANSKRVKCSQLEDLKALVNLRGDLNIKLRKFCLEEASKVRVGGYLLNKLHLESVALGFERAGLGDVEEAVLEGLQPNRIIRGLRIWNYEGAKFPSWANNFRMSLPWLSSIALEECPNFQNLPSLSQLPHLKCLYLRGIPKLEYVERSGNCSNADAAPFASVLLRPEDTESIFFRSLVGLWLMDLPELKAWWRNDINHCASGFDIGVDGCNTGTSIGAGASHVDKVPISIPLFPCLSRLTIRNCPKMRSFPPCLNLEYLELSNFNESLSFGEKRGQIESSNACTSDFSILTTITTETILSDQNYSVAVGSGDSCDSTTPAANVRSGREFVLRTDNVGFLNRLPEEFVLDKLNLEIHFSSLENLSTAGEGFRRFASSLQRLELFWCKNIKTIGAGEIEHLTNLKSLKIYSCEDLNLEEEEDDNEERMQQPWRSLKTSLTSLELQNLPKLVNLPKGMQYLTALQVLSISCFGNLTSLPEYLGCLTSLKFLEIYSCPKLQLLPTAMRNLTSLTELKISSCPKLMERCRAPNGEDWPLIQHIPRLTIRDKFF